jgi:hypothetical protein
VLCSVAMATPWRIERIVIRGSEITETYRLFTVGVSTCTAGTCETLKVSYGDCPDDDRDASGACKTAAKITDTTYLCATPTILPEVTYFEMCEAGGGRRLAQVTSILTLICLLGSLYLIVAVDRKIAIVATLVVEGGMAWFAVGEWDQTNSAFDAAQRELPDATGTKTFGAGFICMIMTALCTWAAAGCVRRMPSGGGKASDTLAAGYSQYSGI